MLPNFNQSPNRSEAKSFVSYVGDGVTKEYRFDIEYLRREFIKVEIDGVRQTEWVFKDSQVITLVNPVPVEAILTIKRITDASRIVEFIDGSILKSKDLNISAIQTVHIAEESRDYMTNTVGVDDEGNIDARFKRVVRVQDAIDPFDATNKRYVDSEGQFAMEKAHAQATASANSAAASKVSEDKAKASEVAAKASEVAAKASEVAAKDSEVKAKASEVAAKASENTVVPLVPIVDQAAKDAAAASAQADDASKRAEQAVVDVKNLGAVPIGAVLVFIKEPLPAGYLALRKGKFDKLTYPDLFEYLGTDELPDFTDRVPKMVGTDLDLLEKQGWCWPTHSHTFSGQTDTQGNHTHTRGTMNIRGDWAYDWGRPAAVANGCFTSMPIGGGSFGGGTLASANGMRFSAAEGWTGETSWNGAHAHNVSGTTSQAGNSDRVEVDRIGVIYAIKAAGVIANEGMAQLDGVLKRLDTLSDRVGTSGAIGFRNKIINGGFDVWQRASSQSQSGYGSADRWYFGITGTASVAKNAALPAGINGSSYFPLINVNADSSLSMTQAIEGVHTFAGKTVTVSFTSNAAGGQCDIPYLMQYFGTGGSPSPTVMYNKPISDVTIKDGSFDRRSITYQVGSIIGKTRGSAGDDYISVHFKWSNPTVYGAIWNIQVEEGTIATPFEQRPYGLELSLCQRYYQGAYFMTLVPSVDAANVNERFLPVVMRVNPDVSGGKPTSGTGAVVAATAYKISQSGFNSVLSTVTPVCLSAEL